MTLYELHDMEANADDWTDDDDDDRGDAEADACLSPASEPSSATLPVYTTIHRIRRLILASIDDPYTLQHFREPGLNALIVRPLVDRLYDPEDIAIVYCLLVNRVYFLREQSRLIHQSVNVARAVLCELVASRILRRFHEDNPGQAGLPLLARILVEGHDPFQGAPLYLERESRYLQWPIQDRGGHERKLTALELAILSESKLLISSSACQHVVDAVHTGQIVYTALSFVDILPDHYMHRPISLYDPYEAPLLNHHRLIVPRIRAVIETTQFSLLLLLYILTMLNRHTEYSPWEGIFFVYTSGWVLHEFAAIIEHGWEVHAQSLWSFLDVTFIVIYAAYVCLRVHDFSVGHIRDGYGLQVLCVAAPVLLTRIAFNILPHNIVFISLHRMMKDFTLLTFLAVWCFTGFLLALQWLINTEQVSGDNEAAPHWSVICKWLLWIWFGLDGTGIEESTRFHYVLGPALMIAFAFLGNTLFLTILVAMLTNTFSRIVAEEASEISFRRTVVTFEGVKSDAIFAYPPPLNIAALAILLPLKFAISARSFHILNVALIRVFNSPLLLAIGIFERRRLWTRSNQWAKTSLFNWQFTGFSPHGDIRAVFKAPLPTEVSDKINQLDPIREVPVLENDVMSMMSADMPRSRLRRTRMLRRRHMARDEIRISRRGEP